MDDREQYYIKSDIGFQKSNLIDLSLRTQFLLYSAETVHKLKVALSASFWSNIQSNTINGSFVVINK